MRTEFRSIRFEPLESRRLLAANTAAILDLIENADVVDRATSLVRSAADSDGDPNHPIDPANLVNHASGAAAAFASQLGAGPDLIQEHDGRLYVVDQTSFSFDGGGLFVFERADDGTFVEQLSIELDSRVARMIVQRDQVLLISYVFDHREEPATEQDTSGDPITAAGDLESRPETERPVTRIVTVNTATGEVVEQYFDGVMFQVHHQENLIVLVTANDQNSIAIYPPPPLTATARLLEITTEGLNDVGFERIPYLSRTHLQGSDFYVASNVFPDVESADAEDSTLSRRTDFPEPNVAITRFAINTDGFEPVARLELSEGRLNRFEVAEDGQTAVAIRHRHSDDTPVTLIDLIDLSNEGIEIFETTRLTETFAFAVSSGPSHLVLRSDNDDLLVIVNSDQSIDVDAATRVRRVDVPDNVYLDYRSLSLGADRVVLLAERIETPAKDGLVVADQSFDVHRSLSLLTLSIAEARFIAATDLEGSVIGYPTLHLIESDSERFGVLYWSFSDSPETASARFAFGHLNDLGEFVVDGSIPAGRWIEIDTNSERLIAREPDQLLIYRWDNATEPTNLPLGEPEPRIEAIDEFDGPLVELGLRAMTDDGIAVTQVEAGDEFWIEFYGDDLRPFGDGVYAAFFDLIVPNDLLSISGPVEYGPGFIGITDESIANGTIDDLGAIGEAIEHPGSEPQQILRFRVKAIASGEALLQPEPADSIGTETLLRGRDTKVPVVRVNYATLVLTINESGSADPLDADRNGQVSAIDALMVIEFLGKFGPVSIDEIAQQLAAEGENALAIDMDTMIRMDTNRNGSVTAADALVVVNRLGQLAFASESELARPVDPSDDHTSDRSVGEAPIEWSASKLVSNVVGVDRDSAGGCVCGGVGCPACTPHEQSDSEDGSDDRSVIPDPSPSA